MEKYFTVNAEKHSIRCKLYYSDIKDIRKVIVFGHGFGGHMDNKAAARFADHVLSKNKQVAVVTFNWPCHGNDAKKKLKLDECSAYLRLVIDHVKGRWDVQNLYGYATSFGGYLFLRYIYDNGSPFDKLAFRCPAVNVYDVLTQSIMTDKEKKEIEKGKPAMVGFDRKVSISPDFLKELSEGDITEKDYMSFADDILIIHGTKDEIVPFEASREFAERNLIEFIPQEGADHRFIDPAKMDQAIYNIAAFFGLK
ncbi:MAG: alpha/beta hydrolase [Lachnospiraceae bacterium]|nr:alpha/beta hydrolase [Lachnospiraceae bacterium]